MMSLLTTYLIPFLIVLTLLVFVHELGHYWVARRAGVRVEVFSIGFGPEIFGWYDRNGTRWRVSIIPLGGYVKMLGETFNPADNEPTSGQASPIEAPDPSGLHGQSFATKPLPWRAAIVAAGPAANYLFAIILFAILFISYGVPRTEPEIAALKAGSAAELAGFMVGERVVAIDGVEVKFFEDISRLLQLNTGTPVTVTLRQGESERQVTLTPQMEEVRKGLRRPLLGISSNKVAYETLGPGQALWMAVEETWRFSATMLTAIGQYFTGARSTDELGGPLRIAQMSGEVAQNGGIGGLLFFMAVLSINLGLINLLPVPMLDGGHLLFYAIEALRGRPLTTRAQEYGFRFGFALVMTLMIFTFWNDLVQLEVFKFFKTLLHLG
jgi:regulator of sigma E protease